MKILPLGTNGWIPSNGRHTPCFLLEYSGRTIIFDCGTGISRLLDTKLSKFIPPKEILFLFSHYHADHFIGLTYLPGILTQKQRLTFVGPSNRLIEKGLKDSIKIFLNPPYFGTPISKWPNDIKYYEIDKLETTIDGLHIKLLVQEHRGKSVGIRLENEICYLTDTDINIKSAIPFARGCKILIHEAWNTQLNIGGSYHCNLADAVRVAEGAGVELLIPMHFSPFITEEEILASANYPSNVRIIVPIEGEVIDQ